MIGRGWIGMALCSLGTAAQAAETGPRLSRAQMLAALDLARPDLAAVSNALARGDEPAAATAFARHLRTRAVPRWEIDPAAMGRSPKASTTKARTAMRHRLESIGIPWQFGGTIDWAFNPTAQPDSKWPVNKEWTWQLNRHPMWLDLARAFHDTGDEKYTAELAEQVRAWVRDCPVPLKKADNGTGSRWRTIEAGIRSGSVWPAILPRVLASKAFDDDALLLFVASWVEHAQYLVKFKTGGNWLAMESNGLYHTGALFPEFREAKLWRDTALERMTAELDIQVYPDGAQVELAPGYHGVSLRNFLGPVNLAARTGFDVPPAFLAKLERMFDYYVTSMQPTRRTPALNDSGAGDVVGILGEGARLFPQRADFRWIAGGGKEGAPPAGLSRRLPYAGQVFLRGGWDPDAPWLCMDAGPFGYGHQHEDKLGITLTAFGRPLLVEGGVYTYDASDWRRYVLSSRAHNVVLVDGLDQARRKSPRETWVVKQPVPLDFGTNAAADWAEAVYDEGWGPDAKRIVRHTRRVVFLKPDLFAVVDRLASLDGKPHRYEALFHLDAAEASIDGLTVSTHSDGPNLAIRAFGADGVSIVKGQKEPVVQGWLPDSSQGYGGIRPIPTAVFAKEAAGTATVIHVLCPSRGAAACPVRRAAMDGEALVVEMQDGTLRRVGR